MGPLPRCDSDAHKHLVYTIYEHVMEDFSLAEDVYLNDMKKILSWDQSKQDVGILGREVYTSRHLVTHWFCVMCSGRVVRASDLRSGDQWFESLRRPLHFPMWR